MEYNKLEVWVEARKLTNLVYEFSKVFPKDEIYGLTNQMRRCSVSIPSNIAEGSGRTSEKEFLHFLNIAISSSYELETQLILAEELFNLKTKELIGEITSIQKMIGGFSRKIKSE